MAADAESGGQRVARSWGRRRVRGGESVTVDEAGNVYVTNGQVFVYSPSGALIGQIDVPERPIQVLFGGTDRRTMFILTHQGLYGVNMRHAGRAPVFSR